MPGSSPDWEQHPAPLPQSSSPWFQWPTEPLASSGMQTGLHLVWHGSQKCVAYSRVVILQETGAQG